VVRDFAFPLGVVPHGVIAPRQGFTVEFRPSDDGHPDLYAFQIVVSHEQLPKVMRSCFELLPSSVEPSLEVLSNDAYRSIDAYVCDDQIRRRHFERVWEAYESFFLEDGAIWLGLAADDPYVDLYLDNWKTIGLSVPTARREFVELMLTGLGLKERGETWHEAADGQTTGEAEIRSVLDERADDGVEFDRVIYDLRKRLYLTLDIDPMGNVDESGREIGMTLWHAVAVVESIDDPDRFAYLDAWVTAGSMAELVRLLRDHLGEHEPWHLIDMYAFERVAHDERPDQLADLDLRRQRPEVHDVAIDLAEAPVEEPRP